ncbi:hypothetical protein EMIHUDRAFT_214286 [Emiliania huxleyi CCMP1516]|uniref:Uncharacterized protein n=2 Tax=Emiliania huxleyi TaxID=2903 RepID=A0A0D3IKX3_EMIH1|nr:hypothetical protein EMIHUDRAFT_214286 [Emiliania huxleyi CCMP1516]EOD11908.1 hypothetical protein EMIHUDRAFT_214286 [Emiliania huxleyi CCMP1516]|eukprot:XP_005764337.1 hypothetical protein EMIHUDRAFT_214286 [Emiliania huxleyi CCMP1516]
MPDAEVSKPSRGGKVAIHRASWVSADRRGAGAMLVGAQGGGGGSCALDTRAGHKSTNTPGPTENRTTAGPDVAPLAKPSRFAVEPVELIGPAKSFGSEHTNLADAERPKSKSEVRASRKIEKK